MSRRVVSSKWWLSADSEAIDFRVASELQFRTPQIHANLLFKPTKILSQASGEGKL